MGDAAATRPGGRTSRTRTSVLAATLSELSERGYFGLTVESVATRAGVHKATVYRRWATKASLVVDAVESVAQREVAVPDTGNLAEDLRLFARSVLDTITGTDGGAFVRGLLGGASEAPEVRAVLHTLWDARFAFVGPLVERGIASGQLPAGTDPDEVLKHVGAPLYYRLLVTAEPLTPRAADLAAASALAAARAGVFVVG